jgi:hypothetical protein
MAITRRRANNLGLQIWEDSPLPKLPELYSGIYVREGGASTAYEQVADDIAAVIHGAGDGTFVRTGARAPSAA